MSNITKICFYGHGITKLGVYQRKLQNYGCGHIFWFYFLEKTIFALKSTELYGRVML